MAKEKNQPETQEEPSIPTREEIVQFLKEQIEVKTLQLQLQELVTAISEAKLEEVKALAMMGQITSPQPTGAEYGGGTPHTVTKEDMEANPELKEMGIKEGDEVIIPAPEKTRSLKKA